MKNSIPQDIVTELMGSVQFTNGEDDCYIAEQIASQSYSSMKDVISTIAGEIRIPKYAREFAKVAKDLPNNSFFAPYFVSHP